MTANYFTVEYSGHTFSVLLGKKKMSKSAFYQEMQNAGLPSKYWVKTWQDYKDAPK